VPFVNLVAIVKGAGKGIDEATALRPAPDFSAIALVARSVDLLPQVSDRPEEIADLMAFVVSTQAYWLTGTTLRMGGGDARTPC
jgi:NADP-dependent 3-hydroxy acid dehydrogenase YdfG